MGATSSFAVLLEASSTLGLVISSETSVFPESVDFFLLSSAIDEGSEILSTSVLSVFGDFLILVFFVASSAGTDSVKFS